MNMFQGADVSQYDDNSKQYCIANLKVAMGIQL